MGPRKSFKADLADINPAMQFISIPEEKPDAPPPGYKYNPLYVETKSRRLQLLIQPSLFDKVRVQAQQKGKRSRFRSVFPNFRCCFWHGYS